LTVEQLIVRKNAEAIIFNSNQSLDIKVQQIMVYGKFLVFNQNVSNSILIEFSLLNDWNDLEIGLLCLSCWIKLEGIQPKYPKAFLFQSTFPSENKIVLDKNIEADWRVGD